MYCIFNYLHRFSPRFLIDVLLNACCVSFLSCGWRSFWYLSGEITGLFLCLIKSRCFPTFTLRLTNLPYLPDFLRYLSLSPPYGRDFLLFTGINLNVYKMEYIILFFPIMNIDLTTNMTKICQKIIYLPILRPNKGSVYLVFLILPAIMVDFWLSISEGGEKSLAIDVSR